MKVIKERSGFVVLFMAFAVLMASCSSDPWRANTQDIEVELTFERFDKELFSINTDSIWEQVPYFLEKYPRFFELYNSQIIKIGNTNQINYDRKLRYFLTTPDIQQVWQEANRVFDEEKFLSAVEPAFKRYLYFFPNKTLPKIYTHISGFNQSIIVDTSYLSVSLDKYLGVESRFYTMLRTSNYKRQNMHQDKLPSDVFMALALTEYFPSAKDDKLLNYMIYHGKVMTFVEAMFPSIADTLLWGYPEEKLQWCEKNERLMWLYLVEHKLLFDSEHKTRLRYIEDAPFTSTFSRESPGRTGQWIGYRIVQSYLKRNPDVTLKELMDNTDYQAILNQSKYKP